MTEIVYYISGCMRGFPDYNEATFEMVESRLYEFLAGDAGSFERGDTFKIINPRTGFEGNTSLPPSVYMCKDLQDVLASDVIVLIDGRPEVEGTWHNSEGANREAQLGVWAGKRFMRAYVYQACMTDMGEAVDWQFGEMDKPEFSQSIRAQACDTAKALITGDRNNAYGPPEQDFRRTADAASAYGYRHTNLPLDAPDCPMCGARRMRSYDTALFLDMVKTSRLMWTPYKQDSWDDKLGYGACGKECALKHEAEHGGKQ